MTKASTGQRKRLGRPPKRDGHTQNSVSYRLALKYRFALQLLTRQLATDKIVALEKAIGDAVSKLHLSRDWMSLYNEDEVTAELNLYALAEYRVDETEKKRRQFVFAHSRFFYVDKERLQVNTALAHVLWPRLDAYIDAWHDHLHEDYNHAARIMAADIKKAGKRPPAIETRQ